MRLADIQVDVRTGELLRDGIVVRLERQPMAVLALLASRPGELVTHDEIRRAVWGDTHVNFQDSLHYCVRQIRVALGDVARQPRFVETIPRRGYRLIARPAAPPGVASTAPRPAARIVSPSAGTWLLGCSVAALLLVTTLIVERRPNNHHQVAVGLLRSLHELAF